MEDRKKREGKGGGVRERERKGGKGRVYSRKSLLCSGISPDGNSLI